jgi:hypothetical protein
MFSVGIFTTHIPYIVFVVFYAWFFISGIEEANNGKVLLSERSQHIEYHLNNHHPEFVSTCAFQSLFLNEKQEHAFLSYEWAQHKLKWRHRQAFHLQEHFTDALFCRPPPQLA